MPLSEGIARSRESGSQGSQLEYQSERPFALSRRQRAMFWGLNNTCQASGDDKRHIQAFVWKSFCAV